MSGASAARVGPGSHSSHLANDPFQTPSSDSPSDQSSSPFPLQFLDQAISKISNTIGGGDGNNPGGGLTANWTTVLALIAGLLFLEQVVYRHKKGTLPGSPFTIPIIGKFADSLNPTLSNYKKGWEKPLSAISVFNIFIVMASSTEYARKILHASTYAGPCLTASAKRILIPENWVFLNGKVHADYRRGLNCLFTRQAISLYMKIQERIYREAFQEWIGLSNKEGGFRAFQNDFRSLNMETSLRVFCGNYITAEGAKEVGENYWLISTALELVNFPLALPGTKVYRAIQARKLAMKWFMHTSAESKKRMADGGEPECLVDRWIKAMIDARAGKSGDQQQDEETRKILIREYSDHEIGMVLMSFLFASQDAMTSGLVFAFQHVADHPEVLEKIREEQYRIRNNDIESPITLENLDQMKYTKSVIKESLRLKPPVIMVPYLTNKPFPMTENYTAPAGSMVIPSFWNSLHDEKEYPDPDGFLPERWMEGGSGLKADPKTWLVYGAGAHKCIGQEYANIHMASVLGSAAVLMDWEHEKTPESEDFAMLPTIFPRDGCRLRFKARPAPTA